MVKTYNKKKDAGKQLSKNFKLNEFDCKCSRCSKVLLDTKLIDILQKIRDHFGKSITVNSGYRCSAHNKEVGGNSGSHHMRGMAADIRVDGVKPIEVAKYAESIGVKRIGLYEKQAFVHIGSGTTKKFWKESSTNTVSTFGGAKKTVKTITLKVPVLEKGDKDGAVYGLQALLIGHNEDIGAKKPDGSFGPATETALKSYQSKNGLEDDGKCGSATWSKLLNL